MVLWFMQGWRWWLLVVTDRLYNRTTTHTGCKQKESKRMKEGISQTDGSCPFFHLGSLEAPMCPRSTKALCVPFLFLYSEKVLLWPRDVPFGGTCIIRLIYTSVEEWWPAAAVGVFTTATRRPVQLSFVYNELQHMAAHGEMLDILQIVNPSLIDQEGCRKAAAK